MRFLQRISGLILLSSPPGCRSASTLSVVRSSPRRRAPSLTPRPPRSSVWSPPSVCSTSATGSHSSVARPRRSRTRPYVLLPPSFCTREPLNHLLISVAERVRSDPRQARLRGQGHQGRCPQASRLLHAQGLNNFQRSTRMVSFAVRVGSWFRDLMAPIATRWSVFMAY